MYKIGHLGNYENVPQIVEYIFNKDIEKLEEEYRKEWNINKEITLCKYITTTPLEIAIQTNNEKVTLWLVEKGVNVKTKEGDWGTVISNVARYSSSKICELFIKNGALENLTKRQCVRIYADIFYGEKFKNIDVFEKYGITVKKYGNDCLRNAISDRNKKIAQMFLDYGADINFNEPEMVYTNGETPVMIATRKNYIELVKWLVENGADITIKDKYGQRPYTLAVLNKYQELTTYIKSLEPKEFHNEEARKNKIKKFKLSKDIVEFFNKENLKIEFSKESESKYIEFYKLEDTFEMIWKRKKYLSLVMELENYELDFLWESKNKNIYILDAEYEEITKIGDWNYFIKNCEEIISKFINGDI
ncbi:ankyrin repeat domain-containing protein [Fusobacteria bacterium ZRK30]|nr:ankyrin repeat domain-containing protein [Fusobacteria bacterium ZRK30]